MIDVKLPLTITEIPVVVNLVPGGSISQPVEWFMTAVANAGVDNKDVTNLLEGAALATVDASHALSWGGITSVVDLSTGEPITGWTLTSESGFDYTHAAVPEPTSLPVILVELTLATALFAHRARPLRHAHA